MRDHFKSRKPKVPPPSKYGKPETWQKVCRREEAEAWQRYLKKRTPGMTSNTPGWLGKWKQVHASYMKKVPKEKRAEYQRLAHESNTGVAPREVQVENVEKSLMAENRRFSDEMFRKYGVRSTVFQTYLMRDQTVGASW